MSDDELFDIMKSDLGIDEWSQAPLWLRDLINKLLDAGWKK